MVCIEFEHPIQNLKAMGGVCQDLYTPLWSLTQLIWDNYVTEHLSTYTDFWVYRWNLTRLTSVRNGLAHIFVPRERIWISNPKSECNESNSLSPS